MVPLYPPLQTVVSAAGRSLVPYQLPMRKDAQGTCRYEMDVEVGICPDVSSLVTLVKQTT